MAFYRIPEQVIEDVKASSELVEVVEQYVRLVKKTGANFFGLCPFHSEDTPSFSVSPSKQIFYCFGCHKGGNVIQFVMEMEKCSYPQAIRLLADQAGIKIPEPDDEGYRQRSEQRQNLETINLEAARFYYQNLIGSPGQEARDYLKRRGIQARTAKKFGLGCALPEWDGLYRYLQSRNLTGDEALLLQSGLFKKNKQGGFYDLFRQRLMFPILDVMGRIVAFGGRVYDDSVPKYINSPETPLYTKGRHLYGYNLAKTSRSDRLIMVEGYMDAIAICQAGIDNVVAALGTALTDRQAQLMQKRGVKEVVIAFDADAAGQAAALRSLDILQRHGIKVTVLQMPEEKDPDDYIRKNGPERFQALLDNALPLLDFKLLVARRENSHDDTLDILAYQDAACKVLAQEENAIVRELYAGRLAEELSAMPETVMQEVERRRQQPQPKPQQDQLRRKLIDTKQAEMKEGQDPATKEELFLLAMLAADNELAADLSPELTVQDFSPGTMQELAGISLPLLFEGRLDLSRLLELCEDRVVLGKSLADLLAQAAMKLEERFGQKSLGDAAAQQLAKQRRLMLRQKKEEISRAYANADPDRKQELKKQLAVILKQEQEMSLS